MKYKTVIDKLERQLPAEELRICVVWQTPDGFTMLGREYDNVEAATDAYSEIHGEPTETVCVRFMS